MTRISFFMLMVSGVLMPGLAHASGFQVDHLEETAQGTSISYRMDDAGPVKTVSTSLFGVKQLGVLHSEDQGSPPHLLVSAKPCLTCEQQKGLYLIRFDGTQPLHFLYPGRIVDPKTRRVLFESRAFFGKCLARYPGDVYVVFQKEKIDRHRYLQSSVYIAHPAKRLVEEKLIGRHMPRIRYTLRRVKAKQCHKIEGWNRLMLSKPLDLTPRHIGDDDDDESDEPKENQTDQDMPSSSSDAPSDSAAGGT